jgi:hypothetical protein
LTSPKTCIKQLKVIFLVENSSRVNYWEENERKSTRKERSNGVKSTPTEGLAPNTCNNLEINWNNNNLGQKQHIKLCIHVKSEEWLHHRENP